MLLRKTLHKTKNFLHKTLQNFKSFIFGGYKKLSKAPSLKLFNHPKMQQLDNFYKEFCETWDSDVNNAKPNIKVSEKRDIESNGSVINVSNNINNNNNNNNSSNNKSVVINGFEDTKDVGSSKYGDIGSQSRVLEQKMKELEMMDMKDEEHVLDVEEVLHYYSLLTSPIYQDLVDKFFTDMYADFHVPQPPVRSNSMNSSIRRLGPLNI
ncbi:hypothetical protein L2E82_16711 [Cichorium intybus]|uniref:Uncharacterized protein n=1 Tax=Cichorium intybus TaxID=13427 RepID=A0ACB9F5M6_CICIN|nr:hypothetical protein L2E82_16711 [Cichorium intybus]